MKTKILITVSLIAVLAFGFLYTQKSNLIADDKDPKNKKDCSSSCTQKTSSDVIKSNDQVMSGANISDDKNGYAVYEFVTDKIHCDGCKPGMSESLMGIQGVKEISFGETNSESKITTIKVSYSASETTPEVIAASVKEKKLQGNCSDGSSCNSKKKMD